MCMKNTKNTIFLKICQIRFFALLNVHDFLKIDNNKNQILTAFLNAIVFKYIFISHFSNHCFKMSDESVPSFI